MVYKKGLLTKVDFLAVDSLILTNENCYLQAILKTSRCAGKRSIPKVLSHTQVGGA